MAHYKSLKDIISQDSWNGLDVGKAEIMSFINKKIDKPGLDPNAIATMLNSLSQKQKGIYKDYYNLKEALSFLYNKVTVLKQQFFNSFNYLTKQLSILQERENSYIEYLSQPLTLNDKILEDILKQSFKELTLQKTTAYNVILTYITGNIELYQEYREAVTPDFIKILDRYKDEYIELELTNKKEKLKFSKLDALTTFNFKTTPEDFIRDYPELYNLAKTDLSEFLDVFKKPDKTLLKTTFTNLELIKAGIFSPRELSDLDKNKYMLQRDYILSKEATTPSQFLIQEKARAGLSLAITPPTEKDIELFTKYGDNYSFLPEDFNSESCREYQETGIYYPLNYILTFNNLLEVYSDLFKVNLLPLTVKTDFNFYINTYNTLLYQLFSSLEGDKKTLHNKKAILQRTFQPLDLDRFRPDKEKLAEFTELLKKLAKEDFSQLASSKILNAFIDNTFKEGLDND